MYEEYRCRIFDWSGVMELCCLFSGKVYESDEHESERRAVFMGNVKTIEQHNWKYFNRQKSYYLGINQFADLVCSICLS